MKSINLIIDKELKSLSELEMLRRELAQVYSIVKMGIMNDIRIKVINKIY